MNHMNREAWLNELGKQITPLFTAGKAFPIKPFRVTCGWPCRHALGVKRRVLGQCFAAENSSAPNGGIHELFISPLLDKPLEVAGVLTHEIAHVAAGIKAGHGSWFVKVCKHVGLTKGKPTSVLPGEKLNEQLTKLLDKLGPYPHQAMIPSTVQTTKSPTSITLQCQSCECLIRITFSWIEKSGIPVCG